MGRKNKISETHPGLSPPDPSLPDLSSEDARLWQAVTAGVRPLTPGSPLHGTHPDSGSINKPDSQSARPSGTRKSTALVAAGHKQGAYGALDHASAPGLDRQNHRRLQKGKKIIEARLDLHGKTEQEARRDLGSFIRRCHDAEKRCVLVITGKGLRSQSGEVGVLRRRVPQWLNENPLRPLVLAFSHATPKDGGEGALYVLIRRKR